jgi:predicted enzyme related to lactoylglutathione lyase
MRCGATIFVKHLEPMASFYAECFGFDDVAHAPGDYRVLESEFWTISIVQVPEGIAAVIELSEPPARRQATPIKLTFQVPSIAEARATITDLGGHVDDMEWEFRGYRHCDFVDPEGNVSQLGEAVAAIP